MGIQFGTSGWRAIWGEEFTFANVRILCQAVADHLRDQGLVERPVVIASDYRFLSERLVDEAATIFSANGFPVINLGFAPTPAVSWATLEHRAAGAINFTASHNPPEYHGLKFSPAWGGPALPEEAKDVVRRANTPGAQERVQLRGDASRVKQVDIRTSYLAQLARMIDFDAVGKLKIAYDPLFGAGRGFLDQGLKNLGIPVAIRNDYRDPLFGGSSPDPDEQHLVALSKEVVAGGYDIGLATDGDADRFGVIDSDGTFILPNYLIALLFDYLVGDRGFKGGAARSISTTHLVDRVGALHDRPVQEFPVGFKYIGRCIANNEIAIGGEESGGLSISGHVPEKDGILACLLACELRARRGKPLLSQLQDLWKRTGVVASARRNLPFNEGNRSAIEARLATPPARMAGVDAKEVRRDDGMKWFGADGSWFLVRLSGTEPMVRLYAEAGSPEAAEVILEGAARFLLG